MTTTFTWDCDAEPTGSVTLRVLTAQFGDGYKQQAADGINNKSQSWPLVFTGTSARIKPIRDFLDGLGGYKAFFWTPPLGTQGYYKAAAYNTQHRGGDVWTLSVTFEQSFQP